jgi:hypothetical protein
MGTNPESVVLDVLFCFKKTKAIDELLVPKLEPIRNIYENALPFKSSTPLPTHLPHAYILSYVLK